MPVKKCPFCAEEIKSDALKCKHCGSLVEPGVCLKCGKQNRTEAKFCGSCGKDSLIKGPSLPPPVSADSKRAKSDVPGPGKVPKKTPIISLVLLVAVIGLIYYLPKEKSEARAGAQAEAQARMHAESQAKAKAQAESQAKAKAQSGGDWVLVPGNPSFGTSDFYVMKYEAREAGGVATSQADVTPWVNIDHTSAVAACAALGSGAHLLTIPEVQTINRNIEAQRANWADGVIGSLVSAGGGLKRGNAGITDSVSYDGADPEYGAGRNTKAKLILSNGGELWDWSGNVWEWVYGAGAAGTLGAPGGVTFDTGEHAWDSASLSQERSVVGPSNSSWTGDYGVGWYYGGTTNAVVRGGRWGVGAYAGVFAFSAGGAPSAWYGSIGFRCGR